MPMNLAHSCICRSRRWARRMHEQVLPWALDGVDLGPDVLEIGPGYGVTTRFLAARVARVTAVEIDPRLARRLHRVLGDRVTVVRGDGAALPLAGGTYSGVACFTTLHHVPTPARQDRLFAEACRLLRPGGVLVGIDSLPSLRFRLLHVADTMVPVDPGSLPGRLTAAGFADVRLAVVPGRSFKFSARKPAP
jgi:SAM-dependent methyltransferase